MIKGNKMLTLFLSGLAFLIWLNVGFTSLKIFSDPIKPLNSGKKEIKPKKNLIESEGLWLNYKDPFGVKVRIPNSKGIFKMTSKKRPESREKKPTAISYLGSIKSEDSKVALVSKNGSQHFLYLNETIEGWQVIDIKKDYLLLNSGNDQIQIFKQDQASL